MSLASLRKTGLIALGTAGLVASMAVATPALASTGHAPKHHVPKPALFVLARPDVLANGTSTTKVLVALFAGKSSKGATVTLATSDTPSGGGSCGTLTATTGTTGHRGLFATTYTASSTVGFCTITATSGTLSSSTTLDQRDATLAAAHTRYRAHLVASPHKIQGNGTSTSTVTLTVLNGTTPVAGDPVLVSSGGFRRNVCGTFTLGAPTTDANGQVVITYTSSTKHGLCFLRAQEAATGRWSNATHVFQTK